MPGAVGRQVVAEPLGTGDLGHAIRPGDPGADGLADGRLERGGQGARRDGPDRVDDRRVPGAAAEDAGQAIEDLALGGLRGAGEEVVGGHQHPGRAGAALGAAAGEERVLQR